jgi:branched-subunit amino acid transport protein
MNAWSSMLMLAAACWVLRIAFITLVPADRLPAAFSEALGFLAPAVIAAIVGVEMADLVSHDTASAGSLLVLGAVAVAAIAYRTRSLAISTVSGLVVVALLDLVVR